MPIKPRTQGRMETAVDKAVSEQGGWHALQLVKVYFKHMFNTENIFVYREAAQWSQGSASFGVYTPGTEPWFPHALPGYPWASLVIAVNLD